MIEPVAASIAGKVAEYLFGPIQHQFQYVFCYNTNVQSLRDEVEDLKNKRTGTELLVDAAKRNAEVVGPDVLDWLKKVEKVQEKANQVLEKTATAGNGSLCCSRSLTLKSRYTLGKKAAKVSREVVKLKEEGKFSIVGYPAPPSQTPYQSKQDSGGFESRMLTRKDVIDALNDSESSIFGICGMAGVGKTTMVQEIASKVKVENLFDEVAMAVVSRDQDLIKIQDQIADALRLTIPEKSNMFVRAERLYARLMDEEKKFLLVLDDLWQELDFRTVGIPLLGERTGFKILLTSRLKGVCSSMGAQKIFEVKVLPKQEAWFLFKEAAGISDDDSEVVSIAEEVAKECGGLPLAIVVVGKALKNKREHAWNDALRQLRSSSVTNIRGMHNLVYSRIEWSYNYLESDEAKLLLLLSSLFPEDYNIPLESLVRYGKGLQLFNGIETMAATRDRVTSITDELKSCYMMLPGKENCIKLHDVVRDVCLSIASKDEHVHRVRHSGLKEWPRSDTHKYYTAIAYTFDTLDQISCDLQYPKLKFLSLVCQSSALILPENFFEGMRELGVLIFSRTHFELSSSLQFLISLQTLCLDHCTLNTNLSIIGSLRGLEILSFYGSNLSEFPSEIRQLFHLRSLDLRFEKGPYPLPPGVLPSLQKLEELYLGAYFQAWWDEEEDRESSEIYVREISSLSFLETFQICTHDSQLLLHILQELHLERLQRFYIVKSSKRRSTGDYQFRRSLHLIDIDEYLLLEPAVGSLLQRTDDLFLSVKDTKKLINELDEDCCANLKKLTLSSCDYKYLINSLDWLPISAFTNLKSLFLDGLRNLTEICRGNVPDGSFVRLEEMKLEGLRSMRYLWTGLIKPPCFGNLKILEMSYCGSVRSLFSHYIIKCLVQLQKIDVYECEMLETIVSMEEEHIIDNGNLEFPKLDYLKLECLESFRGFDSQMIVENAHLGVGPIPCPIFFNRVDLPLQPLFNQVMLPSLEVLDVAHLNGPRQVISGQMPVGSLDRIRVLIVRVCKNLQVVAISDSVRLLHKLELLEVYNCGALEVVFEFEGLKATGEDAGEILCRLESVELRSLPGLRCIWRNLSRGIQAFQRLKSLVVEDCHGLKFLLSPPMAEMLVSLEILRIEKCKMMKEIIGPLISSYSDQSLQMRESSGKFYFDQNEKMDNQKNEEERRSIIVFPRLSRLVLKDLENLRTFCLHNHILIFPSLTKVCIERFPKMTMLFSAEISAPLLRKIDLEKGQSVPFKVFNSWLRGEFCDFSGACTTFSAMEAEPLPMPSSTFTTGFYSMQRDGL